MATYRGRIARLATYRARRAVGWQHTGGRRAVGWQHTGGRSAVGWQHTEARSAVGWQHTGLGGLQVGNIQG